jgi:hypothetical protein
MYHILARCTGFGGLRRPALFTRPCSRAVSVCSMAVGVEKMVKNWPSDIGYRRGSLWRGFKSKNTGSMEVR